MSGTLLKIIPSVDVDNSSVEKFWNSIHKIYKPLIKKIFETKNIKSILKQALNQKYISFEFFADEEEISIGIYTPTQIKDYVKSQIESTWQNCSVKEIEDFINFDNDCSVYGSASLRHHHIFSLKVDKKSLSLKQLLYPLNQLEENEKVLIQVIIKPINDSWRRNASKIYEEFKETGIMPEKSGDTLVLISKGIELAFKIVCSVIDTLVSVLTSTKNDGMLEVLDKKEKPTKHINVTKGTPTKLLKHGFDTDIRVVVQCEDLILAENKLSEIEGIFKELEDENELVIYQPLLKKRFYKKIKERKVPIIKINGNILSVPEISQFCRIPEKEVNFEKIKRNGLRNTHIPKDITSGELVLGTYINNKSEEKTLYWDTKDIDTLMKLLIYIAEPGGGKTETLVELFLQISEKMLGKSIFIDPADGIAGAKIIQRLPEEELDKTLILNLNDPDNVIGLNYKQPEDLGRHEHKLVTKMWTDFFVKYCKIDNHWSSRNILRKASQVVFSIPGNTLLEVKLMIESVEFGEMMLEKIKENVKLAHLHKWWTKFNSMPYKVRQETIKPILNKLDLILDDDLVKNIVCQKETKMPTFYEILNSDKYKNIIILISEGVFYEGAKLLTALIWMNLWTATIARERIRDESKRIPVFLLADEPQNYIGSAGTTKEMVAKARKYKVKPVFSFQSVKQVIETDKKLLRTMLDMAPHLIIGKNSKKTFEEFKEEISPLTPDDGLALPAYHWIAKIYHNKSPVNPFIFRAIEPRKNLRTLDEAFKIIKESALKFGKPVEEVENDIYFRENFDLFKDEIEDDNEIVKIGKAAKPKVR